MQHEPTIGFSFSQMMSLKRATDFNQFICICRSLQRYTRDNTEYVIGDYVIMKQLGQKTKLFPNILYYVKYTFIVIKFDEEIRQGRMDTSVTWLKVKGVFFIYENTKLQTFLMSGYELAELVGNVLEHIRHIPDIALSDCHILCCLRNILNLILNPQYICVYIVDFKRDRGNRLVQFFMSKLNLNFRKMCLKVDLKN